MWSSPLLIVIGMLVFVLGVPFGLYALWTRGQRRVTREIRALADAQGWKCRRRRWQGNPTALRIDARTPGGYAWTLTTGNSGANEPRWNAELWMRFPALAGKTDFAIMPRDSAPPAPVPNAAVSRITAGLAAFDAAYEVQGIPAVGPALAARFLDWPAEAIRPHSIVAWQDGSGLRLGVRLPGPPNWATVRYAVSLGEALAAHVAPPV